MKDSLIMRAFPGVVIQLNVIMSNYYTDM